MSEESQPTEYRREVLKATAVGGALGLAGCMGNSNDDGENQTTSTESQSAGGGGGPTSIAYADREDTMSTYAERFNESQDDVNLNFKLTSQESDYAGMIADIRAGNEDELPETFGNEISWSPNFVEYDVMRDITDFFDSLEYKDDFLSGVHPLFTTYDETVRAVPFWIDLSLYYYNKNHFEQAGLDPENPPTTWSDFRGALETLDSELGNARPPLSLTHTIFFWLPFIRASGGDWLNEEGTEAIFDREPAVKALEYFVDLKNDGLSTDPVATSWSNAMNMFVNEQTSICFSGGLLLGSIQSDNQEMLNNYLGTAMFPARGDNERSSFLGGNNLTITTAAENEEFEAAKEFLRWVNTEEGMKTTLELGFVPGRESGFDVGRANEEPYNTLLEPFQQALKLGRPARHPQFKQIRSELESAWSAALGGSKQPSKALSQAAQTVNNEYL